MTPLLLFLLGCAAVLFGTSSAAFSALMRLSLRIMAEGSGRDERLGRYLDDPSGCSSRRASSSASSSSSPRRCWRG